MPKVEIKNNIFWTGAIDWKVRNFHGHTYSTQRGTTYNSYLVVDEKIALIDTVYGPFSGEFIERIKAIIDPAKIDYIIVNHLEPDHTGALPEIMKLCPQAQLFGTAKAKEGLYRHFYQDWNFKVVKSGDKLNLGKRSLTFLEAPMIHWPDSMFTYCPQEEILFPNDAFGQHYASAERFDDQVDDYIVMDEAVKYYANILWPLGSVILKKIEEVQKMNIPIKIIAPSHGIIWRKSPRKIIDAYLSWSKNETNPKVVIIYETMYGATEKMARKMAEGLSDSGILAGIFNISKSDRTEVIKEMFEAKGYLIGSSTHDNDILPNIAGFLEFLKGLRPKNRIAAAFGSYGWAGGAVKSIENIINQAGITLSQPGLAVQYNPSETDLRQCFEFGKNFAQGIK